MVGRKRKIGARQPNGQLSRASKGQRSDRQQQAIFKERAVVLAQPHRRGNPDQRCACAFGRFCMGAGFKPAVFDAGEQYAAVVRRWRAARGVPTNVRLSEGRGTGEGPSAETVAAWRAQIIRCDAAMSAAHHDGFLSVKSMILDDMDCGGDRAPAAALAVVALAVAIGALPNKAHPFL
jgi:hypothetical protein